MKLHACLLATLAATLVSAPAAEIEGLPKPAAPRPLKLVAPQEKTLANGLRVIVVERNGVPLLSAHLLFKTGSAADPAKLAGLTSFTAGLLTQGTATRTAPQIAKQLEALGATLTTGTDWDTLQLKLDTLSANAEPAFEILADVVRSPKFAPEEIERLRRQGLDELRLAMEQPSAIARAVAARAILGASLYAHPPTGTLASLPRIKRGDILSIHQRACIPANAVLVIVGDVSTAAGFALAEKVFGDWTGGSAPEASVPKVAPSQPRAILIDLPNAGQAAVYAGARGLARTDEEFTVAEVTNAVLGTGYSSRLNQEIRVKRGLSYGAASKLSPGRTEGLFGASCQTKNESAAEVVRVIQTELKRMASEPAEAAYLDSRRAVLTGDFGRKLETNSGYADEIGELAVYGIPLNSLDERISKIDTVTADQTRAFAAEHFLPEGMTFIIVGRAKDTAARLREIFPKLQVITQRQLDFDSPTLGATK